MCLLYHALPQKCPCRRRYGGFSIPKIKLERKTPNGKTTEAESAVGCLCAGISGYDRTLYHQIQYGLFHLRQHLSLRLGPAGIPDMIVIDDEKAMES